MTAPVETPAGGKRSAPAGAPRRRLAELDAVRGLAVACMIVDHVVLVAHGDPILRDTVGRVAMPLFFVLAGHCAGRVRWKHLLVFIVGVVLPLAVPFIDSPNVLCWWALGVALLAASRMAQVPPVVWLVVVLALVANGWDETPVAGAYPFQALFGLMCVGAMLRPGAFRWGNTLPANAPFQWLGRHALVVYIGHTLLLAGAVNLL